MCWRAPGEGFRTLIERNRAGVLDSQAQPLGVSSDDRIDAVGKLCAALLGLGARGRKAHGLQRAQPHFTGSAVVCIAEDP